MESLGLARNSAVAAHSNLHAKLRREVELKRDFTMDRIYLRFVVGRGTRSHILHQHYGGQTGCSEHLAVLDGLYRRAAHFSSITANARSDHHRFSHGVKPPRYRNSDTITSSCFLGQQLSERRHLWDDLVPSAAASDLTSTERNSEVVIDVEAQLVEPGELMHAKNPDAALEVEFSAATAKKLPRKGRRTRKEKEVSVALERPSSAKKRPGSKGSSMPEEAVSANHKKLSVAGALVDTRDPVAVEKLNRVTETDASSSFAGSLESLTSPVGRSIQETSSLFVGAVNNDMEQLEARGGSQSSEKAFFREQSGSAPSVSPENCGGAGEAVGDDSSPHRQSLRDILVDGQALVVEEEDPDWPDEGEKGWGFSLSEFFKDVKVRNERSAGDDDGELDLASDAEFWEEQPHFTEMSHVEWERLAIEDVSPLVLVVYARYGRGHSNSQQFLAATEAMAETIWKAGNAPLRAAKMDINQERDLASALRIAEAPTILFIKGGKCLLSITPDDAEVVVTEDLLKITAHIFYGALKPPSLVNLEKRRNMS